MAPPGTTGDPASPTGRTGPGVDEHEVTFTLVDAPRRFTRVRLAPEVPIPGGELDLAWADDGAWRLTVPRPPVARMEYRFEVTRGDGEPECVLDPLNPFVVPGSFGERSELRFPGYEPPGWLRAEAGAGTSQALEISGVRPTTVISVRVWSPDGVRPGEATPLLLAHDGPEYDRLACLTHYVAVRVREGRMPPCRVALLAPGPRDRWYSANRTYADAVSSRVVPTLRDMFPTTRTIGVGASLGGLAWLHASRRHPDLLDAMFLQSASFFCADLDAQERHFPRFGAIVRFVAGVARTPSPRPVPVVLTCGATEENLANNRLMAAVLVSQGYPTQMLEVPDLHNYTAWRDAFDPALAELTSRVASS